MKNYVQFKVDIIFSCSVIVSCILYLYEYGSRRQLKTCQSEYILNVL